MRTRLVSFDYATFSITLYVDARSIARPHTPLILSSHKAHNVVIDYSKGNIVFMIPVVDMQSRLMKERGDRAHQPFLILHPSPSVDCRCTSTITRDQKQSCETRGMQEHSGGSSKLKHGTFIQDQARGKWFGMHVTQSQGKDSIIDGSFRYVWHMIRKMMICSS
jgi:hypothetical protein